jgi:phosphatidylserine decarboxylase
MTQSSTPDSTSQQDAAEQTTVPAGAAASAAWQHGPLRSEPLDPQLGNIQPGGGVVMRIELAWGKVRRALLRRLRPGYVARMAALRRGSRGGCPCDPVDSRDVKYYRNQATYYWEAADDPFQWRERLPFVRVGLAELVLLGGAGLLLTLVTAWLVWPLSVVPAAVTLAIVWFFRDPRRVIPAGPGEVVSPADGKIVAIEPIDDPLIGPAYEIGIFLSIFNVHANRAPVAGRVVGIEYRPGKMLNALRPESAKENERLEVRLQETTRPYRLMRVRQITGQFARRIVCWLRPDDRLGRGEMFGMIKLGSRTELVLPRSEELEIICRIGEKVRAGSSLLARYHASEWEDQQ